MSAVGAVVRLVGGLLSGLHAALAPQACPGDWLWATVFAGSVLACLPLLGIVLPVLTLRLISRWRAVHTGLTVTVTGLAGLVFALLLPMAMVWSISDVFQQAAAGWLYGLSSDDYASLGARTCGGVGQLSYLSTGPSVWRAILGSGGGQVLHLRYLGAVLALPLLALGLVWWQGRLAFRGRRAWPGRLGWLAFVPVLAISALGSANTLAQVWIGFAPVGVLGVLIIGLVPALRWTSPEPAFPFDSASSGSAAFPLASGAAPLADTPGPLPFLTGSGTPSGEPGIPAGASGTPAPPIEEPGGVTPVIPGKLAWPSGLAQVGDRYQRIRRLGKGGFGTVWLARDNQLDRPVALKIAHAPDAETQQRMLREARALAALHHPNCVRIYDVVADADGLCLVMQYIEGRSLGDAVRADGPLDDVAAARLWVTMASALAAAHDNGVLHRDVKPSNVMVDAEGTPHLLDFGIARSSGDATLTASGMLVGTPDYLAPETAQTGVSTPSSDTWQLAATVSFALTGMPPRGARENALAALASAARADPCDKLPAHSAHRGLLVTALDPDPAVRPSLAVVQRRLGAWLADQGHSTDGPVTITIDRL